MKNALGRVRSIDVFRALTVFLMIFVNDLEGVPNAPGWIGHVPDEAFGLGMADTIFPAFLFIVGLSIPFAFKSRMEKGDTRIPWRIITRSFALILIGFFESNIDTYRTAGTLLSEPAWESLVTISFFFMFLNYRPETTTLRKNIMRGIGVIMLVLLSVVYKSKDPAHHWLHFTWWEILGLIGWSYLLCGLLYYYSKGRLWVQVAGWAFFVFFNIDAHYGLFNFMSPLQDYVWIAGNGSMQAFTMAGVFVSVLYMRLAPANKMNLLFIAMLLLALFLFNAGFIINGGISKSRDTPGWVLICTAISLVVYALFVYIIDLKHKEKWFKIIAPAGAYAFTCYLLSNMFYPVFELTGLDYPDIMNHGMGGVVRGLLFSLAIVWFTWTLAKLNIRLKI